jgi:aspartate/methionine/tyrosine aminotransferase
MLDEEVLRRLARAACARNAAVKILIDETFHDFVLDAQPSSARLGPEIVTINTLTKVYGLGMLRCGWVAGAPEVVAKIRRAWVSVAGIGSRLTEALAALALEHIELFEAHWRGVLAANRPLLREHLGPLVEEELLRGEVAPEGCVCFPEVAGVADTEGLTRELAEQGVYVVPGRFFDRPGHIRIGFGGDSGRLDEALRRVAEAIRQSH